MITEDYISFETAKLLKEKGFKIPYDSFRGVYINGIFKRLNPGDGYGYNTGDEIVEVCSLQMAMKWLREVHNIAISVYVFNRDLSIKENGIRYTCDIATTKISSKEGHLRMTGTYEEVCEAAIKYCLENLI